DKTHEIDHLIADWMQSSGSPRPSVGLVQRMVGRRRPAEDDPLVAVEKADGRAFPWLLLSAAGLLFAVVVWLAGCVAALSAAVPHAAEIMPRIQPPEATSLPDKSRNSVEDLLSRLAFAAPVLFVGLLLAGWRRAAGDRLIRRPGEVDWSEQFILP